MFNIRVAIVQPGIIDTAMARGVRELPYTSLYPHMRRMAGLFTASLHNPASPFLVGEKIRDIIESATWQLRHPIGPDAEPFLQWRASMTDEQWVDWGAADDDTWYQNVERDFGLNARLREYALVGSKPEGAHSPMPNTCPEGGCQDFFTVFQAVLSVSGNTSQSVLE
jgi:hypothetical protein